MRMGRVYCEPFIKVWLVLFLFRFQNLTASSKESFVKAEFNECLLGWTLHMHNVSEALYRRWNFCMTSWPLIAVYAVGVWYSATSAPFITYSIFTWGYYTSFSAKIFKHSFGNISQWCNTPYWCSRRWCRFSNSSGWVFLSFHLCFGDNSFWLDPLQLCELNELDLSWLSHLWVCAVLGWESQCMVLFILSVFMMISSFCWFELIGLNMMQKMDNTLSRYCHALLSKYITAEMKESILYLCPQCSNAYWNKTKTKQVCFY